MTRDEALKEAGAWLMDPKDYRVVSLADLLQAVDAAARAEEREACAAVCLHYARSTQPSRGEQGVALELDRRIMARGDR